jgi:diacylglycerol kinase family enzyme
MHALLILNAAAGSFRREDAATPEALVELFHSAGAPVQLRLAPSNRLSATLQAAVEERPDVIYVGGGDGTLSTAAGCLMGTNIALGAVPLGTLNHFARDLGTPLPWREAVRALARAETRLVDVGEVNGRVFINNCSIGAYAAAVQERDALRNQHGTAKGWAMARATLAEFRRLRRLRLRIAIGPTTLALRTPFVVVSNNRYSGHVLDHSLRARLDEGRLWIYTTRAGRHLEILRLIWRALLRSIDQVEGLDVRPVTEATITRENRALPIAADGELTDLQPPLRFRIRPQALRVVAPNTTHAAP